MAFPGAVRGQLASVEGTLTARDPRATGVVVYLTSLSAASLPLAPVTTSIDQRGLKFLPRTIAVPPGSSISFPNSDPLLHNIFLVDLLHSRIELGTYPGGELRQVTLASSGAYLVLCHLHPEMAASVLVVDAPYRAITDSEGRFRIDSIEPGTYRLSTWHRRLLQYEETFTLVPGGTARVQALLTSGTPVPPARGRTTAKR
jgi:plastocyanin